LQNATRKALSSRFHDRTGATESEFLIYDQGSELRRGDVNIGAFGR